MSTVNINSSLLPYCSVIKHPSLNFFTFQPFSSIFMSYSTELLIGTAGESAAGGLACLGLHVLYFACHLSGTGGRLAGGLGPVIDCSL